MRRVKLSSPMRVLAFIVGMTLAIGLLVYSIRWEDLPIQINMAGQDVTVYALAGFLVLIGIMAHTMIKSGLLGEMRLD